MAAFIQPGEEESMNRMLITVAAGIFLICAVVLLLFVYLANSLPLPAATAIAVVAIFAGSLFCWKSFATAQTLLFLSILATEFVIVNFAGWLLAPFIAIDALVLVALARAWQAKED